MDQMGSNPKLCYPVQGLDSRLKIRFPKDTKSLEFAKGDLITRTVPKFFNYEVVEFNFWSH